jgi:hypothetical protein
MRGGQAVGELIQRGAKVVHTITDNDAQLGRRFLHIVEAGDEPPFVIELSDRLVKVRLNEPFDRASERFEMVFGPIQLENEALQWIRHALTSPRMNELVETGAAPRHSARRS